MCFSAPFLWNTGTLGGGERGEGSGEGSGEAPGEVADAGEASVNGEREGEGETGVDMMPGGIQQREGGSGREWMSVSMARIDMYHRKTLNAGGGRRGGRKDREEERQPGWKV